MSIAPRLKWYLESHHVDYELVHHRHSASSMESARTAGVPSGRLAKCVLLEDERGYVMAIIPASCRLELAEVERELDRHLELASEAELGEIFAGCELGAVPPRESDPPYRSIAARVEAPRRATRALASVRPSHAVEPTQDVLDLCHPMTRSPPDTVGLTRHANQGRLDAQELEGLIVLLGFGHGGSVILLPREHHGGRFHVFHH